MFKPPPRALPVLAAGLKVNGWKNVEMIAPIFGLVDRLSSGEQIDVKEELAKLCSV